MKGKLISAREFRSYALEIVNPAIGYFIAQMTGPLEEYHKMYRAARFFDTFFVKEKDLVTIREHVQYLSSLGFLSLNSACITVIIDTELKIL